MYCDYNDKDFIDTYNGLEYGYYKTEIEGNTLYIKCKLFDYEMLIFWEKWVLDAIFNKSEYKTIYTFPMVKRHEYELDAVLRLFGFGNKYNWIGVE